MIALDTNVLVRFLVEDDEKQTQVASQLIRDAIEREQQLFISDIVMCETVWVLSSSYRFSRAEIVEALAELLRARAVVFTSTDRLARALEAFAIGKGDFADYLIREHAVAAGANTVATFDRSLLKERGFSKP
ncbi:MAG: type II toxin-antitoxin system VapC family toxin [Thermoanaerobaculales bacterium]|jgi:predicted nucleic-acid-binding protein|nr:type II toxin-antitoxin system VapC family toxin [Thermoanaerobaculales bacterium]